MLTATLGEQRVNEGKWCMTVIYMYGLVLLKKKVLGRGIGGN